MALNAQNFESSEKLNSKEESDSPDVKATRLGFNSYQALEKFAASLVNRKRQGEKITYNDIAAHEARQVRKLMKEQAVNPDLLNELVGVIDDIEKSEEDYLNSLRDTKEGAKIVNLQEARTKIMQIPDKPKKVVEDSDWVEQAKASVSKPKTQPTSQKKKWWQVWK